MQVSRTSLRPLLALPLLVALAAPLPAAAAEATAAPPAASRPAATGRAAPGPVTAPSPTSKAKTAPGAPAKAAAPGAAATTPAGATAPPTPTTPSAAPVATPRIVPFEQWAPAACPRPTGEDAAPLQRTVVHHTHEPVARTPEEVVPALALTCAAHVGRGFSTIGYHYVVDPWGGIWQGRGGMPAKDGSAPATQAQGAHVAGSNAGAVGVVFLGDHAAAPPTAAALEAATGLLAWLHAGAGTDPAAEVRSVSTGEGTATHTGAFRIAGLAGHSDSNATECPGEHLRALLGDLRTRVQQVIAGQQPASWASLAAPPAPGNPPAPPAAAPPAVVAAPAVPADAAPAPPAGTSAPAAPLAKAAAKPTAAITAARPGPVALPHQASARALRRAGLPALARWLEHPEA